MQKKSYFKTIINFILIPLVFSFVILMGTFHVKANSGVYVNENFFPDEAFRNYIVNTYDTSKINGKDYIDYSVLQSVTVINLNNYSNIKNLKGIEKFPNLKELYLYQCTNLTSLDISSNTNLEKLTVTNSKISNLNVSQNTNLKELYCQMNQLSSLDLSKNSKLEELNCRGNAIKSLDLSGNPNIKIVDCHNNVLTGLNLSNCSKLTYFNCDSNQFSALNFSNYSNLTELYCANNTLTSVYVNGCKNLKYFNCNNNKISDLNLDDCVSLISLNCSNNKLSKLNIRNSTALDELLCYQNNITDLIIAKNGTMDKNISSSSVKIETTSGSNKPIKYSLNNKIILWKNENASIYKLDSTKTVEVPMNEAEIRKLVTRFYYNILGREPDAGGVDYHTKRLMNKETDGAGLSRGFFMSPEMEKLNLPNDEFVKRLYETYFQRTPNQNELDYWTNNLSSGKSREFVLAGFVNSPEFEKVCNDYGIKRGTFVVANPEAPKKTNNSRYLKIEAKNVNDQQVTNFVSNLYKQILQRNAGDSEIAYWKEAAINGKSPDGIIYNASTIPRCGFFASKEYMSMNKSDEEFIIDAYHAFFGREAANNEIEYWKEQLRLGTYTRDTLLDIGFGTSDEFQKVLRGYGFEVTLIY